MVGKSRCRMHGGAPGSGAPHGTANGNYRTGRHTLEAIQARREIAQLCRQWRELQKLI